MKILRRAPGPKMESVNKSSINISLRDSSRIFFRWKMVQFLFDSYEKMFAELNFVLVLLFWLLSLLLLLMLLLLWLLSIVYVRIFGMQPDQPGSIFTWFEWKTFFKKQRHGSEMKQDGCTLRRFRKDCIELSITKWSVYWFPPWDDRW